MKTKFSLLVLLGTLTASAATVQLQWNPSPTNQQDWAMTTNDAQKTITYYVFMAGAASGPFTCVGSTNDTNFFLPIAVAESFFYIKASNYWGMSDPSNIARVPAPSTLPNGTRILPQTNPALKAFAPGLKQPPLPKPGG